MFSIIIPTWNNLELLKICVRSIQKNSSFTHQIILHINGGEDGSLSWAKENHIEYTHSDENIGICFAVNQAAALAKNDWIVYMNDDMYCCPEWDIHLIHKMADIGHHHFMLSATMIEPIQTGNNCVSILNCGQHASDFNEAHLLAHYKSLIKPDWYGSTWPPTVVHKTWWHRVGGYSTELSPGMSSDNDFSMKMWHAGCRIFLGVGNSLVYHFGQKSTQKITKNNGRRQFFNKWGISQKMFDRYYLQRGKIATDLMLPDPTQNIGYKTLYWKTKMKHWLSYFSK